MLDSPALAAASVVNSGPIFFSLLNPFVTHQSPYTSLFVKEMEDTQRYHELCQGCAGEVGEEVLGAVVSPITAIRFN
jgi:hypothetical protein